VVRRAQQGPSSLRLARGLGGAVGRSGAQQCVPPRDGPAGRAAPVRQRAGAVRDRRGAARRRHHQRAVRPRRPPARGPARGGGELPGQRAPGAGGARRGAVCVPRRHRRGGGGLRRPRLRARAAGDARRADRARLELQRALPQPLPGHPAASARGAARGVRAHRPGAVASRRGGAARPRGRGGRMTSARVTGGPLPPLRAMRYLALGDSYTIGEGVAPADRWPARLARALRAEGVMLGEPKIIATTGWTTDELSAALEGFDAGASPAEAPVGAKAGTWDFVSLLIGVNNQYRGHKVDEYRDQFAGLLARAIAYAGGRAGRVLVLS